MTRRLFLAGFSLNGILQGRPGTVILLSVETGKLLAAEHPERAARTLARPGSVVKPFTLSAALKRGPVGPFPCPRHLAIRDRQLDCSHARLGTPLTAADALAYSCNNFVARAAASLSTAELTSCFQRAGLTTRTGLLQSEVTGQLQPDDTLAGRQLLALGEDGILITPLGLAAAYRQLARQPAGPVHEGLRAAVQYGTAQLATVADTAVAGKTGTAMSPDRSHRQAWFAGYAPADRPEAVIVVFLPQGSGGGDAAPIARQALEKWRRGQ